MTGTGSNREKIYKFGRCTLFADSGDLVVNGQTNRLGRKTLAILLALLKARGGLLTREEIFREAWPDTIVQENTIQAQMSALRKALGEDRYLLETLIGRGYRLVTQHEASATPASTPLLDAGGQGVASSTSNLPKTSRPLIGREDDIASIVHTVALQRLVTLTGPAGIGKTRLSLEIARECLPAFPDGVFNVELATMTTPEEVYQAVGSALGLFSSFQNPRQVVKAIGDKKFLILLDNCEHIIDAAAVIAETIVNSTPYAQVLATSREALRVDWEYVIVVPPLSVPGEDVHEEELILQAGAVRLFLQRARAAGLHGPLDNSLYDTVAEICRRLDGIPLAIELAAARASTLGVAQLQMRLADRFQLLSSGHRTALPRHQTLQAAIDWSYDQLRPLEKELFARLAIFGGQFSSTDAASVVAAEGMSESAILEVIGDLTAKSMLTSDLSGGRSTYRYLETVRIFAREKLVTSGDETAMSYAHATYFKNVLGEAEQQLNELSPTDWVSRYGSFLTEVRTALHWAYTGIDTRVLAADITLLAASFLSQLSLDKESAMWIDRALASIPEEEDVENVQRRMKLSVCLGPNRIYSMGGIHKDCEAGCKLALLSGNVEYALRGAWYLFQAAIVKGDYQHALALADKLSELAIGSEDPLDAAAAARTRGLVHQVFGELPQAQRFFMKSIQSYETRTSTARWLRYGIDMRVASRHSLSHVLWLRGSADQAMALMEQNLLDPGSIGHGRSLCTALGASAVPLCLWTGQLEDAARHNLRLRMESNKYSIELWMYAAEFFDGVLQLLQGKTGLGLQVLQKYESRVEALRYLTFTYMPIRAIIGEALALLGNADEGVEAISSCLSPEKSSIYPWAIPEILRLQGEATLKTDRPEREIEAETLFLNAFAQAQSQDSLVFQLRSANSLASLYTKQDRVTDALAWLAPVRSRFVEGLQTGDLREADRILAAAGSRQ